MVFTQVSFLQWASLILLTKVARDLCLFGVADKGPYSQAMVFPVVNYGCESWTIKKAERQRIDAFELWCWKRLLRIPWTARRSNKSILMKINPQYSLEGLMVKLKLQYLAAAAAKSLQSRPTLCDPRDGSPPGSPVPGILQARTLEWVAIFFSNA